MDIKKLLKQNLINILILGLIVAFYIIGDVFVFPLHDATDTNNYESYNSIIRWVSFLLGAGWAAFTIYSNITLVKEADVEKIVEVRERLIHAGNKRFFVKERTHLLNMLESLESRKKYFSNIEDGKLKDLYYMTRSQMMRNITNVSEYIESFDYISGVDSGYAKEMCDNSQDLLNRFNKLVELSVTYDDTTLDYDTREIDDMIEALQEMRDTGKARLGS